VPSRQRPADATGYPSQADSQRAQNRQIWSFGTLANDLGTGTPSRQGAYERLAPQKCSRQAQSDPQDVAVVVLDSAVKGITPARLPKAGSLSNLSVGTRFTAVGYGAQSVTIDQGPTFHYADIRYVATGGLNALNPSWLRLSMNPARGDGGTCYGDSGGSNFLGAGTGETNIVAGTTITGDFMCRATNVDYRMDTASARAFPGQYVTLP